MTMEPAVRVTDAPAAREDLDLAARVAAGDESAFEELVRTYGGRLFAAARRLLGNDADAADAVQDALLSAFGACGRFSGDAKLGTWLNRIVINACLMRLRKRKRLREDAIEELLPQFGPDGEHASMPDRFSDGCDVQLERAEECRFVRERIESLPETHRTILLLRDIQGLSTEETAQLLGTSTNVVKVRLHRARQALRTLLEPRFGRLCPSEENES